MTEARLIELNTALKRVSQKGVDPGGVLARRLIRQYRQDVSANVQQDVATFLQKDARGRIDGLRAASGKIVAQALDFLDAGGAEVVDLPLGQLGSFCLSLTDYEDDDRTPTRFGLLHLVNKQTSSGLEGDWQTLMHNGAVEFKLPCTGSTGTNHAAGVKLKNLRTLFDARETLDVIHAVALSRVD